ncbi:unnamed protein product [Rhizoctonia solani]|uniref:Uncharacterized protein n=1 Tax=Rhizoctonia solani TaxID=456999 RepID=A0A8H3GQZ4_9AGAM|nr:unnamed protein product [Rhizoctonia solani]
MSSPAPTGPAALKVFRIPELARLICAVTRKHDNANLMQACRKLFRSILPFVWEQVDGPNALMSMIPGGVVYHESESGLSPYALPGSLELSRFNIYAPHVKRLILSHLYVNGYDEWERFHSYTRSVDLLPNLEAIYFPPHQPGKYISNGDQIETDAVNWAIAFLSTSLQTLSQTPPVAVGSTQAIPPLWLDFDSFHNLMSSVAKKCPNLRSLNILSAQIILTKYNHWGLEPPFRVSFSYDSPETYSSFAQLGNLTCLVVSAVILCPEGLDALSNFPMLESLRIVGSQHVYQTYCNEIQLATGAFPALKYLDLDQLTWGTIVNLFNEKPLISGLQSLGITEPHPHFHDASPLDVFTNFSDIAPLLATHNSKITRLFIDDIGDYRVSWRYAAELTEDDFTPIQSLSDATLYLKTAFILEEPREENAKIVARYLSILRPLAPVICEYHRANIYLYNVDNEHANEESRNMINAELSRLRDI